MDDDFIPLLSGKGLLSFTASEFKTYVRSLFHKPEPKAAPRLSEKEKSVKAQILKSGKVSITTTRKPKYITEAEMSTLAKSLDRGENELFIAAKSKGIAVYPSHEIAAEVKAKVDELPW